MPALDGGVIGGFKWKATGQQLIGHDTHGVQVAPPVGDLVLKALRRHVQERTAAVRATAGHLLSDGRRNTVVHDFYLVPLRQEHVLGLDVLVDDARIVPSEESGTLFGLAVSTLSPRECFERRNWLNCL